MSQASLASPPAIVSRIAASRKLSARASTRTCRLQPQITAAIQEPALRASAVTRALAAIQANRVAATNTVRRVEAVFEEICKFLFVFKPINVETGHLHSWTLFCSLVAASGFLRPPTAVRQISLFFSPSNAGEKKRTRARCHRRRCRTSRSASGAFLRPPRLR